MDQYKNLNQEADKISVEIDEILDSDGSSFYYDKSQEEKVYKPNLLIRILSGLMVLIVLLLLAGVFSAIFILTAAIMILCGIIQLIRKILKK